ncbi:MAG: hypothetical protein CFE45_02690 [Burkholderiales bacterium PBB5]|nr:MAG: hypothetical protein CFE45_02690 [Burkholderiales bacterium PBB5]
MKALMSQRAKDVLADPRAKGQLRAFLAAKSSQGSAASADEQPTVIELRTADGRTVRLLPRVWSPSSATEVASAR